MRKLAFLIAAALSVHVGAATQERGLTAVDGVTVGHHTLAERPTGCTVVLVRRRVR